MEQAALTPERNIWRSKFAKLGGFAVRHAIGALQERRRSGEPLIHTDAWWEQKRAEAEAFMEARRAQTEAHVLVVVTSQHPLVEGMYANEEFGSRTFAGAEAARDLVASGAQVDMYIPGSLFMIDGIVDGRSLSDAGVASVHEHGLPPEVVVHGDEANNRYKPDDGVYTSADEAFVAAQIFRDNPHFTDILLICGPEQAARWDLHAVANGISPRIEPITPPSGQSYHATLGRTEKMMVGYTRRLDPTWQADYSFIANTSRLLRKPPE